MRALAVSLCLSLSLIGCGNDTSANDGSSPGDGSGGGGDGSANVDMSGNQIPDGGINVPDGLLDGGILVHDGSVLCFPATCQGKLYQCGNCLDDDGDNLIDAEDPDCLGPCQNNEKGFSGQIPGQNNAPCKMDCYWDQDTGSGNDHCEWDHGCDPHEQMMDPEIGCTYDPNLKFPGGKTCADRIAMQDPLCKTVCGPLTPNGCDCFGCCVIPPSMSMTDGVYVGSQDANGNYTCDLGDKADPMKCRPCEIVTSCFKPCGHCQLCVGKNTLPDDCYPKNDGGMNVVPDGGVMGQCPGGEQPCGLQGQLPCPQGYYCITGCCEPTIG